MVSIDARPEEAVYRAGPVLGVALSGDALVIVGDDAVAVVQGSLAASA